MLDVSGLGGTIKTVLNSANYLATQDYEVEIVSVFRHHKKFFFDVDDRVTIQVMHNRFTKKRKQKNFLLTMVDRRKSFLINKDDEALGLFSPVSDLKLISWLRSVKKDQIVVTTRPSLNILANKFLRKGVIHIGQEHLNFDVYEKRMRRDILKHYPKMNAVLTLTNKDTLRYKEVLPNASIQKLTNSIPIEDVKGVDYTNKVIVAAGRLVDQKGFDLLIKSFSLIKDEFPDWKVKIYGQGKEYVNLEFLIQENELYNQVHLMGPSRTMNQDLSKASIYALTSRYEGFGMVIAEAMAVGLPVVSFNCPEGPEEIISHGEDGYLVSAEDINEFSMYLKKLMNDQDLRTKLGNNAKINVKRYSTSSIGQEWVKLLNSFRSEENNDLEDLQSGTDSLYKTVR